MHIHLLLWVIQLLGHIRGQELTITVSKKLLGANSAVKNEDTREKRDTRYRQASSKLTALNTAADYLDDQIAKLEDSLVGTVELSLIHI